MKKNAKSQNFMGLHNFGKFGGIDLIKFDIEGAEWEVFRASHLVHNVQFIIGELKADEYRVMWFRNLLPFHEALFRRGAQKVWYIYAEVYWRAFHGGY